MIKLNKLLPPLLPSFHKGQLGRLAVIGGCEDYTGAPYFAAHAAMLSGVDLVHIVCDSDAANVIKTYSPDLMVHPYMLSKNLDGIDDKLKKIQSLIDRMDVVIVGPGYGRDNKIMLKMLIEIIRYCSITKEKPLILDADALYHLAMNNEIQKLLINSNNKNIIITPNVMELRRLRENLQDDSIGKLLGVTVVEKGTNDIISYHGNEPVKCSQPGSLKRVGGQGDSMTGMIGAFIAWSMGAYKSNIYKHEIELNDEELITYSCLAGCSTTRLASHLAYKKYGRSMLTSNLHEFIPQAFNDL